MLLRGPLLIPFHRVLLLLVPILLLGGCGSPPRVEATAARPVSRTEDAAEFRIDLRLSNTGEKDFPLERFQYSLIVEGLGRFEGRWAALRTTWMDPLHPVHCVENERCAGCCWGTLA